MENNVIRIIQISDIHLFADKGESLLGVNTHESFAECVKLLQAEDKRPDTFLLTGDLSQDDTEGSYQNLLDLLTFSTVPTYFIPGNHDHVQRMEKILNVKNISSKKNIVLDHWQIILLSSQVKYEVFGLLNMEQLQFLEACLKKYPDHHAMIAFHHHPVPVGSEWLDQIGLKNADQFWQMLQNYPNVRMVLFGHVHQEAAGIKQGIPYYSAPSTCIQFKRQSKDFKLDEIGPGYRWLDLYPNGEVKTGVVRVDHYVGQFQENARGY